MADPQGQSVLDQALAAEGQQASSPTQPQSAPADSGSVLDQAMQAHDTENKPVQSTGKDASTPYNWFERAEGSVLEHLPFAEDNRVLSWVNKHVAQPPVRMGQEIGNMAVQRG